MPLSLGISGDLAAGTDIQEPVPVSPISPLQGCEMVWITENTGQG